MVTGPRGKARTMKIGEQRVHVAPFDGVESLTSVAACDLAQQLSIALRDRGAKVRILLQQPTIDVLAYRRESTSPHPEAPAFRSARASMSATRAACSVLA